MKTLVYNTPHGQLLVSGNGEVTLRFESLYMQLSSEEFMEFVNFVNSNISIIAGKTHNHNENSFYHKILQNMKKEYIEEFTKLINVPIYSPDYGLDIFDSIKLMKSKQIGIITNHKHTNLFKIDPDTICHN